MKEENGRGGGVKGRVGEELWWGNNAHRPRKNERKERGNKTWIKIKIKISKESLGFHAYSSSSHISVISKSLTLFLFLLPFSFFLLATFPLGVSFPFFFFSVANLVLLSLILSSLLSYHCPIYYSRFLVPHTPSVRLLSLSLKPLSFSPLPNL